MVSNKIDAFFKVFLATTVACDGTTNGKLPHEGLEQLMSKHLWIAFVAMLGMQQSARALEIPLHPTEVRIVAQIIAVEELV